MQFETFVTKTEEVKTIQCVAKDANGGGKSITFAPTMSDARQWVEDNKLRCNLKVSVEIMVREVLHDEEGNTTVSIGTRCERVFKRDLGVEADEAYYWSLKKAGEFDRGQWVVIRNCNVLIKTWDEEEARNAVNQDGRNLMYRV